MALNRRRTTAISAQNTFSSPIAIKNGGLLTLEGTFTATVSLQRQSGSTWYDVTNNSGTATTFTTPGTYQITPSQLPGIYRWGVKTGNYTSGTVTGTIEGR